jgi:hypothetical protein
MYSLTHNNTSMSHTQEKGKEKGTHPKPQMEPDSDAKEMHRSVREKTNQLLQERPPRHNPMELFPTAEQATLHLQLQSTER